VTPEDILEAGIENLEKYGHIKGHYGITGEGFCAHGAMRWAASGQAGVYLINLRDVDGADAYDQAVRRLDALIRKEIPGIPAMNDAIVHFNDAPETTTEDVKLMMKRAITHES